jgi:prepilin-type N-terminal cleavage/methylation domain-containing protein
MAAMKKTAGFTLVELLVSLTVFSLVMAGASTFYVVQSSVRLSEQLGLTMDANLRLAVDTITFSLRNTGYGAPTGSFASWIPWVAGLTANPMITAGANAATPDTVSVASCTSQPVAHLAAGAVAGATTLTLDSAASLNAINRRLIFINDNELALIQSIAGNVISIDTNPVVVGPQGVSRAYAIATPICRVDVVTYSVDTTAMKLMENDNQGAGAQAVMDGVTNLKIVATGGGTHPKDQVTLTAKSSQIDPSTRAFIFRSLSSTASTRN